MDRGARARSGAAFLCRQDRHFPGQTRSADRVSPNDPHGLPLNTNPPCKDNPAQTGLPGINPRLQPDDATWPGEAPDVSLLSQGYAYLTETRFDQMEPVLETVRRDIIALGLPLRSIEVELGPSQCEFTFQPQVGLSPADSMILFRSAVKQICRRQGYHASFMCRPKVANTLSSGWHLHQSLIDRRSNANAFASP